MWCCSRWSRWWRLVMRGIAVVSLINTMRLWGGRSWGRRCLIRRRFITSEADKMSDGGPARGAGAVVVWVLRVGWWGGGGSGAVWAGGGVVRVGGGGGVGGGGCGVVRGGVARSAAGWGNSGLYVDAPPGAADVYTYLVLLPLA